MMAILNLLGFLWCLPNTILGLLLAIPYGARDFAWEDWCIKCTVKRAIGNPGAQTWGVMVMAVGDHNRIRIESKALATSRRLWRHERRHTRQAFVFGVLMLVAYSMEWIARFLFKPGPTIEKYMETRHKGKGAKRWFRAYWRLSWERDARGAE